MSNKILVTGGLGYIGSHISHKLGKKAVIIDNKSNSSLNFKKFLPDSKVYLDDINQSSLEKIFKENTISTVIHLAGFKAVNESIKDPLKYYDNNILSSLVLLESMDKFKIKNLIFSSSATVYGILNNSPLTESSPLGSINPYGSTKIIIEQLLTDYSKSNKNFKAISLRYFNPIGSNVNSGLSDQPLGEPLNLMPLIIEAALGKRILTVYGDDYDTSDGTCIRDYIHVQDLAEAHIKALKKINSIKNHVPFNIGMGKGISVLNLIKIFEEVNDIKVPYKIGKRRKGDAPITFSSNLKAKEILDWSPRYKYEDMCRHSWLSKK